ncbi:hypothetical protein ACET3Z_025727 [Daucus carota]
MSATVRPDVWELFRDIFREGGLYLINKMVVRPAFGYYRSVSSEKRIILLPSTMVTVLSDDGVIPDHKFEFVPLQDLNPYSVDPFQEHTPIFSPVRVTRVWPRISELTEAVRGYNSILLNRHNHRIHARVNNDIWQSLDGLIVEGGLYEISTFTLTNSSAFLRPVSSTRSIRFLNVTTVQPYMDTSRSFPEHGFEFVSVDEVQRIAERNNADELPFHTIGILLLLLCWPGVRLKRIPGDEGVDNYHLTACPWTRIYINMDTDDSRDMRNELVGITH